MPSAKKRREMERQRRAKQYRTWGVVAGVVIVIAIVAVVGQNMRGTPGIAGKTFNALGTESVNMIAIAQGSSESNISFVIEEKSVLPALQVLHRVFGLHGAVAN